ncbi:MAG: 50S ribosomal protein L14e [Candidatus Caldarchaeales archaeon]
MKEEIGRIVVKTSGREASRKCVIVSIVDKNFVVVTGPKVLTGVKRRRLNISHLAFTPYKINIREDADDEEVLKALEDKGLIEYMRQHVKISPKALPLTTS